MNIPTVNLRASVSKELENDVLRLQFLAQEQKGTPLEVQDALRVRLAEAIAIIAPLKVAEELEVETGSFSVSPMYRKTIIAGYQGSVSVTVFGTDTATIASLASKIKSMNLYGSSNSLSRKSQKAVEKELIQEAIAAFKEKADLVTAAFGNTGWRAGELEVNASSDSGRGYSRGFAISASAASSEESGGGISVEGGKTTVSSTVSGTIALDSGYAVR